MLRDQFAMAAFRCCHEEIYREGKLTGYPADWRNQIARDAYAYADAMLQARDKTSAHNDNDRGFVTLTDEEREAVEAAVDFCESTDKPLPRSEQIATLRGLLERTKSDK